MSTSSPPPVPRPSDASRLQHLLAAGHPCVLIQTFEEGEALQVIREATLALNRNLLVWSASGGIQDGLLSGYAPVQGSEDPVQAFTHLASRDDRPVCVALDLLEHLTQHRTLRALRNLLAQFARTGSRLILVDHSENVPPVIGAYATRFALSLPGDAELETLVRETLRSAHREHPIEIDISRSGFHAIIRNLRGLTRRQAEQIIRETVCEDRRFDDEDINHVVTAKRKALNAGSGLLEFVESPVDLTAIGGLTRLKQWLEQRRGALTDKAADFGLAAPRGVLMLGVQGAGKSLCAKAIAAAWQQPLMRMDVGALYDRYVGESERRLRDALRQAEHMAPIILWFDEIEKAFASAAAQSTDGGLSKRMFGTLLTWMQEHGAPVFLVATANDIEALPPELLRKGRFDEIFFVDLPTRATRAQIFAIHLRKRGRDPAQFDLAALADSADGFSGAEIEQAIIAALHRAFHAGRELTTADLAAVLAESPPLSVTMAERIARLRRWAHQRCVPAE